MSYVEWSTSINIDLDNTETMTALFQEFNAKMIESGLISLPNERMDFTPFSPVQSSSWDFNSLKVVAEYAFKLPVGHAKTEFEDVSGETYKKVKRASYYKTDTILKFSFCYLKAIYNSEAEFKKHTVLLCRLSIRTSNTPYTSLGFMGNYYQYGGSVTFNGGIKMFSLKSYIVHTEDTLSIYYLNHNYPESGQIGDYLQFNRCLVNFILKRSKDFDSVFLITPPSTSSTSISALYGYTLLDGVLTTYAHNPYNCDFLNCPYTSVNVVEDGVSVYNTIRSIYGNIPYKNDSVYITKNVPNSAVLNEDNMVVMYKGKETLISSLFMGKTSQYLTYLSTGYRYSFILMKPNYEITTEDLT